MSKLITELWYGTVSPISSSIKNNSEIQNLLKLLDKNHHNLEKYLNKEQKRILERYCECSSELASLLEEQAFCDGFSIGVKILTESLSNAEQII